MAFFQLLDKVNVDAKFAKPKEFHAKKVAYGTAGFRTKYVKYTCSLNSTLKK